MRAIAVGFTERYQARIALGWLLFGGFNRVLFVYFVSDGREWKIQLEITTDDILVAGHTPWLSFLVHGTFS